MLHPFLDCCALGSGSPGRRSHKERKLRMLIHWRDAAERQLAALNAAITTLESQMARDADRSDPVR